MLYRQRCQVRNSRDIIACACRFRSRLQRCVSIRLYVCTVAEYQWVMMTLPCEAW